VGDKRRHKFKVIDLEQMNREEKRKRGYTYEQGGVLVNRLGLTEPQMLIAISEIEMYLTEMYADDMVLEYVFFPFILAELASKGGMKELDLRFTMMEMVDKMILKLLEDPSWPYHNDVEGYRDYMHDQLINAIKLMLKYSLLSINDNEEIDFKVAFKVYPDSFGEGIALDFGAKNYKPCYQELSRRGMRVIE